MRLLTFLLPLAVVLDSGCGPARPSESSGEAALRARLDGGNDERISLQSFKKTDGQLADVMGVKIYKMDFKAQIEFRADALYKTGGLLGGAVDHLETRAKPATQGFWDQWLSSMVAAERLGCKGQILELSGEILFESKESGWNASRAEIHIVSPPSSGDPACAKSRGTSNNQIVQSINIDVRNLMTAQEVYFTDHKGYANDWNTLQTATNASLSVGNTASIVAASNGYTITITNSSTNGGITKCTVQVGAGAASTVDGVIACAP